ncbi:hypothetical protein MW887_006076 [Aspergillus wentii]|nr:hypothetical protein MW887_006076 [Aspergillus wentii]
MTVDQKPAEKGSRVPFSLWTSTKAPIVNEDPQSGASDSTVSDGPASDIVIIEQAEKDRIKARLKRSSSRLLSLLGFRGSYIAVKTLSPQSESLSDLENINCAPKPSHLVPEGDHTPPKNTGSPQDRKRVDLPVGTDIECPVISFDTLNNPSPKNKRSRQKTEILSRQEKTETPEQDNAVTRNVRRSRSSPTDLANIFSWTMSTTFGNSTVIHRTNIRPRPRIQGVQLQEASNDPLSKQGDSTNDSSDPSTPTSGTGSPFSTSSTSATSEPSSNLSERWKWLPDIGMAGSHNLLARNQEPSKKPNPTEAPYPLPTIVTVEATANAKVFFETYFSSMVPDLDLRAQRKRELEQYIYSLPLTAEEQTKARKDWIMQERNYLRQYRVLKSRSHSTRHEETVSIAGYEPLKILGKGSFGLVRLVKEKGGRESEISGSGEENLSLQSEAAYSIAGAFGAIRSVIDGNKYSWRKETTGMRKEVYAMKVIRKSEMIRNSQEGHLRAERDFLVASAGSRWVVPLIASFQDINNLYLVMDYMVGGDFLGLLLRRDVLSEKETKWYSLMKYLRIQVDGDAEDRKDAKKANKSVVIKQSAHIEDSNNAPPNTDLLGWRDKNQRRKCTRSVVGTSQYMAPEVVRGDIYDGRWESLHQSKPPWTPKFKSWEDTRYFEDADYISEGNGISANSDGEPCENNAGAEGLQAVNLGGVYVQQSPANLKVCAKNEKEAIKKQLAKAHKKDKEKKRARDKILRDEKVGKTVMDMRKKGAFLGYTYRRPKGVAIALNPERGRPFRQRGHLSDLYVF